MSKKSSNIDMLHGPIAIKITMLAIPIILTAILTNGIRNTNLDYS